MLPHLLTVDLTFLSLYKRIISILSARYLITEIELKRKEELILALEDELLQWKGKQEFQEETGGKRLRAALR